MLGCLQPILDHFFSIWDIQKNCDKIYNFFCFSKLWTMVPHLSNSLNELVFSESVYICGKIMWFNLFGVDLFCILTLPYISFNLATKKQTNLLPTHSLKASFELWIKNIFQRYILILIRYVFLKKYINFD